ncbi:MAG TPA: peptidase MA family metallohydrolase, partial [Anaerolineales bacterium]
GPDQRLLTEQRIPHELMHIMLYQSLGQGFANLPDWLNEGLASDAELYPNPDYQIILNSAYQKKSLLPISSLCQALPRDVSSALLAYAQSASFTRYLHHTYGMATMQSLVRDYGNGLDCGRGLEAALGQSLPQLERQWRQDTFAENASLTAANNLLPWGAMLVAVLGVPMILAVSRLRRASSAEIASDGPNE